MKVVSRVVLLCLSVILTACTMGPMGGASDAASGQSVLGAGTVPGNPIGGSVAQSMDSFDRVKLNRALDKAPGTATNWVNENTGSSYSVTPIQKLTVNGNPLCRRYQVISVRAGNRQQTTGTACVASDGAWSEV